MACFQLMVCLPGDVFNSFYKVYAQRYANSRPFSIVIFTCCFNIGSLNVSFPQLI